MARRLPSPPPPLHGYTYVRPLGSGGFADVFCYEQQMPRRTVAVKVLLADVPDAEIQEMFRNEAMVMAQLASHPSVLTVYEANISADGRPYLVTELCPGGFGDRFRAETIPLAEVLQVAISVGSVLETAHRAQVLHRDIKPANILITQYGRPVLADFGIAATIARAEGQDAVGMSIPWSCPEVILGSSHGNIAAEVWSFGATVYALLAGRSPFEVPGSDNSRDTVQRRILSRTAVRPTGRPDAPASMEQLLARCLDKDPAKRPATILDVLHDLQLIEAELGIRPTPLEIATERILDPVALDAPSAPEPAPAGRRRVRGSLRTATAAREPVASQAAGTTVLRVWSAGGGEPASQAGGRTRRVVLAAVAAAAAIATIVVALVLTRGDGGPPTVGEIDAGASGASIVFSWSAADAEPGDTYLVRVNDGGPTAVKKPEFTYDTADHPGRVCISVAVVRDGKTGPASDQKCVEG